MQELSLYLKSNRLYEILITNNKTAQALRCSGSFWKQSYLHSSPPLVASCAAQNITTVYGMEGGTISVNCTYNPRQQRWREKSWCRQINGSKCQHVVSARRFWLPFLRNRNGTTSISDNIQDGVLTVTMRRLRKQDAGLYQCRTEYLGETSTLRTVQVDVLTGGSRGSEFHGFLLQFHNQRKSSWDGSSVALHQHRPHRITPVEAQQG
uniref:Ig-like domain-containing protein n=1 Tax=Coturnix japonica TaxID=93934 RepID=A0A8C2U814_COTJA